MDFVEICSICVRKAIINAAKRMFNSDKIGHSLCFLFWRHFFGRQCMLEILYGAKTVFTHSAITPPKVKRFR